MLNCVLSTWLSICQNTNIKLFLDDDNLVDFFFDGLDIVIFKCHLCNPLCYNQLSNIALLLIQCFSPIQPKWGSEAVYIYGRGLSFPEAPWPRWPMWSAALNISKRKRLDRKNTRRRQSMHIYVKENCWVLPHSTDADGRDFKNQMQWRVYTQDIPKQEAKMPKWSPNIKGIRKWLKTEENSSKQEKSKID